MSQNNFSTKKLFTEQISFYEIWNILTEVLLLKIIHVFDMITVDEILHPIVLLIEHTDHLTDAVLVLDIDHVLIPETKFLQNILLHKDLLQDQEILDILKPALTLIQEKTLIHNKPNR